MADKQYICGYNHCLHHGQPIKKSEAVMIGRKYYHWDCAEIKQKIKSCADMYIENVEDKSTYPAAINIITNMVFKNRVPVDYIYKNLAVSGKYYSNKPVHVLYGIRKLFWEKRANL